jgi:hypothetical protein
VGAAIGGGLDLAIQLYQNHGNIGCVKWGQVAGAAALGALGGFAGEGLQALRAWRAASLLADAPSGAQSAMNAVRLAEQLQFDQAASVFTETGELTPQALEDSNLIIESEDLGNPLIPDGYAKYALDLDTPVGPGQVHFYMNPSTGQPFYALDYKFLW